MNRADALQLVHEHTQSPGLRQHMLAVEAAMRAYAQRYGEDVESWGLVGLLHDFDYERYPNPGHLAAEEHPSWGVRLLSERGLPQASCRAILGHASYTGVPRDTLMAKALFAVDELSGFLVACALVWLFLWHTRWGYELRAVGHSESAALYAGISRKRSIVVAMCISGALAGLVGVNEVMGVQHRLLLNFTGGAGYVGIAVALMGRNHPVGIVLAAVLFGALYQGGSELSFDMPALTRDMVVVIQGLIILVCGALEHALRGPVQALLRS